MTSAVTLLFFALLIIGAPIYLTMGVGRRGDVRRRWATCCRSPRS